jgi:hypothetical protein
LLYPLSSGATRWIYQTLTSVSAIYTRSVYAKAQNKSIVYIDATGAGTVIAYFNLSSGTVGTVSAGYTATITAVGNGWYRCTMTNSTAAAMSFSGIYGVADADGSTTVTANGTDGIYLWGAQFVSGSSAGTYQRIAAATDYATAGFLPYLATDGTDDTLSSGNIDLTGTSKLSAVVGATKNNDSNVYAIVDFGASGSGTAGGFSMWAGNPASGGAATWASSFQSSAGGVINIISPTNFPAPATAVITGILDTVTVGSYLRVNGALQTTSALDPTDGTFGNLPLRLSRSGANGLPGRIYQLVVVGKALSASEIASTEAFVNTKTGAY